MSAGMNVYLFVLCLAAMPDLLQRNLRGRCAQVGNRFYPKLQPDSTTCMPDICKKYQIFWSEYTMSGKCSWASGSHPTLTTWDQRGWNFHSTKNVHWGWLSRENFNLGPAGISPTLRRLVKHHLVKSQLDTVSSSSTKCWRQLVKK